MNLEGKPVAGGMTSVLVAVYNVAPYLDQCISSIVDQDERNLEIIVIDDASTDGSGEIADRWAQLDPRISVVHKQSNAGLYDTRNLSVNLARGEFIAFVDGDDYIMPNMISTLRGQLEKTGADVAICGWTDLMPGGSKDRSLSIETGKVCDTESTLSICFPEIGDMNYNPFLWNKLFRHRTILDDSGNPIAFNAERISCEDTTWLIKVLTGIKSAVFVREALYQYRAKRPGNKTMTASVDPKLASSSVDAFLEGWGLLDKGGHSCAINMFQRTLIQRQRGLFAAIARGDEEVWDKCSKHYLRDVGAWFLASSPSAGHLVWCLKRFARRIQLEIRHLTARI